MSILSPLHFYQSLSWQQVYDWTFELSSICNYKDHKIFWKFFPAYIWIFPKGFARLWIRQSHCRQSLFLQLLRQLSWSYPNSSWRRRLKNPKYFFVKQFDFRVSEQLLCFEMIHMLKKKPPSKIIQFFIDQNYVRNWLSMFNLFVGKCRGKGVGRLILEKWIDVSVLDFTKKGGY